MDWRVQTHYNPETNKIEYQMSVNAVLYNNSNRKDIDMNALSTAIKKQINTAYNISEKDFISHMSFNLRIVNSINEIKKTDHVFQIVNQKELSKSNIANTVVAAEGAMYGLNIKLGTKLVDSILKGHNVRSVAHELGHTGGLGHLNNNKNDMNNLMMQAFQVSKFGGDLNNATKLNHSQIRQIRDNYINNKLNRNSPLYIDWLLFGKMSLK
jgi:predicted Zn-dependent protease